MPITTKNTPILLLALAGAIFASCASADENWVVLTKKDLSDKENHFREVWEPSEAEVPRSIKEVRRHLEKLKKTTTSDYERKQIVDILAGWDKYVCQVVGYTKDGKKLMHLNFFPKADTTEDFKDWRHRYVVVFDGGASYWRIEYDGKKKVFLNFSFNGDA